MPRKLLSLFRLKETKNAVSRELGTHLLSSALPREGTAPLQHRYSTVTGASQAKIAHESRKEEEGRGSILSRDLHACRQHML